MSEQPFAGDIPVVLIVANFPTPYRIPLFRAVSKQFRQEGFELHVIFAATGSDYRRWTVTKSEEFGFAHEFLVGNASQDGERLGVTFRYRGVARRVRELAPSAVITVGFSLAAVRMVVMRERMRPRLIIWTGATRDVGSFPVGLVRRVQRKLLVRRAAAFIAYGSAARSYLEGLGVPPDRIHVAINTVDTEFFARRVGEVRARTPKPILKRLLYVGYLIHRKNVGRVIEAMERLARVRNDFVLDIVGDGSERARLEQMVRDRGLERFVEFHGYRQQEELPEYFGRSTLFLFQTDHDIWGLVLNEAMAAGLPCLASTRAGSTHDLIRDGETGFAVDFSDVSAAADKINWALNHPKQAARVGNAARSYIANPATLSHSAKGFLEAVRKK